MKKKRTVTVFIPFDNGSCEVIAPGAFNPKDFENLPVKKLMDHNVIHNLGKVTEVSLLSNGGIGFTWQANDKGDEFIQSLK